MKIIFDLDGTLICCKKRIYDLFMDLSKNTTLDYDKYWALKFQGLSNELILKNQLMYSDERCEDFVFQWMEAIESEEYLSRDSVFDGVFDTLDFLKNSGCDLYICTARQSRESTINQLKRLKIYNYFEEILVTAQKEDKKTTLICSDIGWSDSDWILGDTGHDIRAGQVIGLNTCAVLTGIMTRERLIPYEPDFIIKDVSEFRSVKWK